MFRSSVKWSLLLSVFFGVAGPAAAQAVFAEKTKDLGGAPRGAILTHKVKVTNKHAQELHVSGIRTSCGVCSHASIEKNTLAPGESTQLNITIDTNKYSGHRAFTVYVTFDRPYFDEQQVSITAVSREDLSLSPTGLSYGAVRVGSNPVAELKIDYRGGLANWAITGITNDNGYIQPKLEEVSRHFGQVSYRLTVKLREDLPTGSWHADLWLNTNDQSSPKIRVPLTVDVQGVLTAAPASLDLGRIAKGGQLEKKVVLRGAEPFKITKIEGMGANIEVTGQSDEPKAVQVLRVRYNASADAGDFSKQLKFITEMKKDKKDVVEVVEVTLRGNQAK